MIYRVTMYLFRLLHASCSLQKYLFSQLSLPLSGWLHGMDTLVNHSREAAASTCLAIIFFFQADHSDLPWFLRSTAGSMQLPHQCRH